MTQDVHHRLVRHIAKRKKVRGSAYNPLRLLNRLIACSSSDASKGDLLILKIAEARESRQCDVILDAISAYISLNPTHPEPWLELTKYYRDDNLDLRKAVLVSEIAVLMARVDGNFVRQCLGERMRTLLHAKEILLANECLAELVKFRPNGHSIDVNFEADFLLYPIAQQLDEQLVKAYKARMM